KGHGLNVETGGYEDLFKAGIIDPTMVTRSALQNAASIAKNIITTEAIVAEAPEKEKMPAGMPRGGTGDLVGQDGENAVGLRLAFPRRRGTGEGSGPPGPSFIRRKCSRLTPRTFAGFKTDQPRAGAIGPFFFALPCARLRERRWHEGGSMRKAFAVAAVVAVAAFAAGAWAAGPPTPAEKSLQRDVKALQIQVKGLQKSVKALKKADSNLADGIGTSLVYTFCGLAVTADGLQGTWQENDQLSAAVQTGKTYFGPQTPVN